VGEKRAGLNRGEITPEGLLRDKMVGLSPRAPRCRKAGAESVTTCWQTAAWVP